MEIINSKIQGNLLQEFTAKYLEEHKELVEHIRETTKKQLLISGVSNSKRFERQDLLRAYQAGAIEQKDNNLKSIDVVTLGNLQEDSQVWYERYIG